MTPLLYLLNRFFYRIAEFLRHWYLNSFRIYGHFIVSILEKFDRTLAFRITWQHLFEPLYQDRSFIGYTLGFIFRSGRLAVGGVLYTIIIALAAIFYLIWLLIPVFVIYKILSQLLISYFHI